MSTEAPRVRRTLALGALAALAVHAPLAFWVGNWTAQPEPRSLLVISAAAFGLGAALYLGLERVPGVGSWRALVSAGALLVLLLDWRPLTSLAPDGVPAWVPPVVVVPALGWIVTRRGGTREVRVLAAVLVAALAAVPATQLAVMQLGIGRPGVESGAPLQLDAGATPPDLYVVVLDAYARDDVLAHDYGFSNAAFLEALTARGFSTPTAATATYSTTHLSLSSFLAMDYVAEDAQLIDQADRIELYEVMQGRNPLVDAFRDAGYRYVHAENDWRATRCGPAVDLCLSSGSLDDTSWGFLQRTPLASLVAGRGGHPHTTATLERFDQFSTWGTVAASFGAGPNLVFVHVLAPHPSLHLTSDCSITRDPVLGGTVIAAPHTNKATVEARRRAFVAQTQCVNRAVIDLVDALSRDTLVVLVGDHGPDSRAQLFPAGGDWSEAATRERMGTLISLRLPAACHVPDDLSLVNVLRLVLDCAFGTELGRLPDRHFRAPAESVTGWVTEITLPGRAAGALEPAAEHLAEGDRRGGEAVPLAARPTADESR